MKRDGNLKSNLEQRRKERWGGKLSRSGLARKLRVNRSYITLLEKGLRKPSAEMLFRMSKVFGCPVTDLYEYLPQDQEGKK